MAVSSRRGCTVYKIPTYLMCLWAIYISNWLRLYCDLEKCQLLIDLCNVNLTAILLHTVTCVFLCLWENKDDEKLLNARLAFQRKK